MQITTGRVKKPFNVVLYGVPGIGKSTWAEGAPDPLFIGAEENDELNAKRMDAPASFDEFIAQLKYIIEKKPEFETLVIDTIDSVEKLLHKKILGPEKTGSMAAAMGGYGKAYEAAERGMIEVRDLLKTVRDKMNKNVIVLAHSTKVTATDTVIGLAYDTYEMSLHKKAQPVFVDWASAVLFANYIAYKNEDDNTDKVFALGHGERVVFTEKRPGFLAKNRFKLPYEMPLEFQPFFEAYNQFYELEAAETIDQVSDECLLLLSQIKDQELKTKVLDSLEASKNDLQKLKKIRDRIKEVVNGL